MTAQGSRSSTRQLLLSARPGWSQPAGRGRRRTPVPGDNQKADNENHNSAVEKGSMPAETEIVKTPEENVCYDAAPGDDDECSEDEGTENVSCEEYAEVAEVVEEIIEVEAEDSLDGEEEANESRHCKEQVGESQNGDEEAG